MKYDIIIIGGGPGGYVAAIRGSQNGKKVALIEKDKLGGVCLNWGCIPTKSILKSANVFNYIKKSHDFGIKLLEDPKIDINRVIDRSREIANKMSNGINHLMKKNKIDIIKGVATLNLNKSVIVTNEKNEKIEYYANNIIIATGASQKKLPHNLINNFDNKKLLNVQDALSISHIPKSICIIGSGAIGIEFASFFNSIGSKVTILEKMDNILPTSDKSIQKELTKILTKKGINILCNSNIIDIQNEKDNIKIIINNIENNIITENILCAIGVSPNSNNIGLETVGIEILDNKKIKINEHCETNIKGYYAIGDVTLGPDLAHLASSQAIIAINHICNIDTTNKINYDNIPSCIYSFPEISWTGFTEEQCIEKGLDYKVGIFPFYANGKSTANGNNNGFIKTIIDNKYGEILGCHMIGDNVTELISEIVTSINLESTDLELIKSIHPHPTLSECIVESIENASNSSIHI